MIKKIENILDWQVREFKNNDIFVRKMKAILQRKRDNSVYSYYIVLKRKGYARWRDRKEIRERYKIAKVIRQHRYTYFFAKSLEHMQKFVEYLKLGRPVEIQNITEKPLIIYPYKYSYVFGVFGAKKKKREKAKAWHLKIEPDPEVVIGWLQAEGHIIFIEHKYPFPQLFKEVNFLRWKVFIATKYAFWDFGIIEEHKDLIKEWVYPIRRKFKGRLISPSRILYYYNNYKEQSKKFDKKIVFDYAYTSNEQFEKKLKAEVKERHRNH